MLNSSEVALSGLLHLMHAHALRAQLGQPCARLASVVARHLNAISEAPDVPPLLRASCEHLQDWWDQAGLDTAASAYSPTKRAHPLLRLFNS